MITLYSKATSNGRKASIMLEETGLPYRVRAMDLDAREQKEHWFTELNPQGRIPVIVDDDGPEGRQVTVFESGAILVYLAEKSGRFLPVSARGRAEVMNWLMYASTHLTFTCMQVHWQVRLREQGKPHELLDVWQEENDRVYGVFERGLADERPFLAGEAYSIADVAAFPWIHRWRMQEIGLDEFSAVSAWYARVSARDAVRRGLDIPPRGDAL